MCKLTLQMTATGARPGQEVSYRKSSADLPQVGGTKLLEPVPAALGYTATTSWNVEQSQAWDPSTLIRMLATAAPN